MDYLGQVEQDVGNQLRGQPPAGMSLWGSSSVYSVKNVSTANYLAAHPDGLLVAEDNTTGHHDVPWNIYSNSDGQTALKSCHGKYLDVDNGSGLPTNNGQDPNQSTWELTEQGQGVYSIRSQDGRYLQAVPPSGDQQQVFLSNDCGEAESWQIEPMSKVTDVIDDTEGRFF